MEQGPRGAVAALRELDGQRVSETGARTWHKARCVNKQEAWWALLGLSNLEAPPLHLGLFHVQDAWLLTHGFLQRPLSPCAPQHAMLTAVRGARRVAKGSGGPSFPKMGAPSGMWDHTMEKSNTPPSLEGQRPQQVPASSEDTGGSSSSPKWELLMGS